MKTLKVTSSAGKKYGHVPGHNYHDVDVTISRTRPDRWTIEIVETWGGCQGHDEEHGRKTIMARGRTLEATVEEAARRAEAAELDRSYTTQALSCAEAGAAEEEEEALEEETIGCATDLSKVFTEHLIAEIRSRGATSV